MVEYEGPFSSTKRNKKFYVIVHYNGITKRIDFGDRRYVDYTVHHDEKRRKAYLARASQIRDGNGNFTRNNPLSANYWAMRLLWAYKL